jgi:hypothetical protein
MSATMKEMAAALLAHREQVLQILWSALSRINGHKPIQLTSFDVERKSNLWSKLLRQSC